jgi:hypothetical protein
LKTAASYRSAIAVLLMLAAPAAAYGTGNVSAEIDGRLRFEEAEEFDAELHLLGLSLRHTFADSKGDRLTLFSLVRAESDLSEVMLHELYARYKGPLGAWDLTAGRFRLPYGLMYSFDAATLLYDTPHDALFGMDSDNGVMLSGIRGPVDYAVSLTQGYGHHTPEFPGHGVAMVRLGIMPGETEEFSVGISGAYGKSSTMHDVDSVLERALAGADATLYLGQWLSRLEIDIGKVAGEQILAGFAGLDYALMPRIDINLSASVIRYDSLTASSWFAGMTWRTRWLTVRGGYSYDEPENSHRFAIQAYYLFSRGY